jgi:hypothetical protein
VIEKDPKGRKSVIVFYDTNVAAAKQRVQELKRRGMVDAAFDARLYHVHAWSGEPERVDGVVLMPDVTGWQRGRLLSAFAGRVLEDSPTLVREIEEPLAPLAPLAAAVMAPPEAEAPPLAAEAPPPEPVSSGPVRVLNLRQGARNKWYIDSDDGIAQAGPFDTKAQAEAQRAIMQAE